MSPTPPPQRPSVTINLNKSYRNLKTDQQKSILRPSSNIILNNVQNYNRNQAIENVMTCNYNSTLQNTKECIRDSKPKVNDKWTQDPFRQFKLLKTQHARGSSRRNFIQSNINKVNAESEQNKNPMSQTLALSPQPSGNVAY